MSTFENVSGHDRIVVVDGRGIPVPAGEQFTVHDSHDGSLVEQPYFKLVGKKKPTVVEDTPETPIKNEGDL